LWPFLQIELICFDFWFRWNFSVGQNDVSYVSRSLPTTYDLVQDQTTPTAADCGGQKIPDTSEEDPNISETKVKEEIINPWMPQETENEGCDDCDVQSEFHVLFTVNML
jgi:hypothetical protein